MPRPPTRFSRVSIGFVSSTDTLPDYDAGDTGPVLSVTGQADFPTAISVGGGTTVEAISLTTVDANFGSINPYGYSTITVGVSGAADGDFLSCTYPSLYSGTYNALSVFATSGDTTGEVNLVGINSGATAVDPASAVVNILRIGF